MAIDSVIFTDFLTTYATSLRPELFRLIYVAYVILVGPNVFFYFLYFSGFCFVADKHKRRFPRLTLNREST